MGINVIILVAATFMGQKSLKKRLWHKCLSVNTTKFLRTRFIEHI